MGSLLEKYNVLRMENLSLRVENVRLRSSGPDSETRAMLERLQDYDLDDPANVRTRLVARWKKSFPEAAAETSAAFHPLVRLEGWLKTASHDPDEIWFNDVYHVTLRRHDIDPCFGMHGGMTQLGINSHDGVARHDWRDFQAIKNQLAGVECEAFELYPADSRLLDPSNYYTLWCFPGIKRIKVGVVNRLVRDADQAWSAQRRMGEPK